MTDVTADQFKFDGDELIHVPTGARFSCRSGYTDWGDAGAVLPDGRDFEREEVAEVTARIIGTRNAST